MTADQITSAGCTRRCLLQAAVGAVGWRSMGARAQVSKGGGGLPGAAAPATVIHSELKMLGSTVYAFLQREAPGQSNLSISNFGIVAGPRSLLAIDAGGGPQHARNFIAAAKPLGKPFDRVVITHSHPDHIVGLTQFPADIEIVAQEETRKLMAGITGMPTPAYWATNPAWGKPGDVNRIVLP